jgi:hypothetical protein
MAPAVRSTSSATWSEMREGDGFDHDHFSKKNCLVAICINTNSLLLAERLVSLPESGQGDLSKASVLGGAHELGGARERLDEERSDLWTFAIDSLFPFCSHGAVVGVRSHRNVQKIGGRDRTPA